MSTDLIPSGRFAQLARLSRKALRIYAEIGLLRPVLTDKDNGYHYYSQSQLEEAWRIAHLRGLGMSIETIQQTIRAWNTPAALSYLEQYRQQLAEQEAAVRAAIVELEQAMHEPKVRYSVNTRQVVPQRYVCLRQLCTPEAACAFIDTAEEQLLQVLRQSYSKPLGVLIARYHAADDEALWDVEICQAYEAAFPLVGTEGVVDQILPGGQMAYVMHPGEYTGPFGMQAAYEALWVWTRDHGYNVVGPPQETYLFEASNTAHPADYRTEIGWFIE